MRQQQVFAARTALVEVDGGENPLFGKSAVEVDFHIARALELLVYYVVHTAARVHEGCGKHGETSAFGDLSRRTEKPFRLLQRGNIQPSRESASRLLGSLIVRASESCDAVHEYNHVLTELDASLGVFEHKLGDGDVVDGTLVKGGADYFGAL